MCKQIPVGTSEASKCTHACLLMWKPEVRIRCLSWLSTVFTKAGSLGEPRAQTMASLVSQLTLRVPCLVVPSAGVTVSSRIWSTLSEFWCLSSSHFLLSSKCLISQWFYFLLCILVSMTATSQCCADSAHFMELWGGLIYNKLICQEQCSLYSEHHISAKVVTMIKNWLLLKGLKCKLACTPSKY